jgi:hypothetical protein
MSPKMVKSKSVHGEFRANFLSKDPFNRDRQEHDAAYAALAFLSFTFPQNLK